MVRTTAASAMKKLWPLKSFKSLDLKRQLQTRRDRTVEAVFEANRLYKRYTGIEERERLQDEIGRLMSTLRVEQERRNLTKLQLEDVRSGIDDIESTRLKMDRGTQLEAFGALLEEERKMRLSESALLKKYEIECAAVQSTSDAIAGMRLQREEWDKLRIDYIKYISAVVAVLGFFGTYFCTHKEEVLGSLRHIEEELLDIKRQQKLREEQPGYVQWAWDKTRGAGEAVGRGCAWTAGKTWGACAASARGLGGAATWSYDSCKRLVWGDK